MENILSNTQPMLFYKFNDKYYASYDIKETTVIGTDDVERSVYMHNEIVYKNKPTLEKYLADISEVEILTDAKEKEYIEAYNKYGN